MLGRVRERVREAARQDPELNQAWSKFEQRYIPSSLRDSSPSPSPSTSSSQDASSSSDTATDSSRATSTESDTGTSTSSSNSSSSGRRRSESFATAARRTADTAAKLSGSISDRFSSLLKTALGKDATQEERAWTSTEVASAPPPPPPVYAYQPRPGEEILPPDTTTKGIVTVAESRWERTWKRLTQRRVIRSVLDFGSDAKARFQDSENPVVERIRDMGSSVGNRLWSPNEQTAALIKIRQAQPDFQFSRFLAELEQHDFIERLLRGFLSGSPKEVAPLLLPDYLEQFKEVLKEREREGSAEVLRLLGVRSVSILKAEVIDSQPYVLVNTIAQTSHSITTPTPTPATATPTATPTSIFDIYFNIAFVLENPIEPAAAPVRRRPPGGDAADDQDATTVERDHREGEGDAADEGVEKPLPPPPPSNRARAQVPVRYQHWKVAELAPYHQEKVHW